MEGDSSATPSVIDGHRCSDIERDQVEGASGVTLSIIDELHF